MSKNPISAGFSICAAARANGIRMLRIISRIRNSAAKTTASMAIRRLIRNDFSVSINIPLRHSVEQP